LSSISTKRVALVHDYLTQYGGAERVLDALHEMFPAAPVFTSIVSYDALPKRFRAWDIRTSPLQRVPGADRYYRAGFPLFPLFFRTFDRELREFDLVIADSSAWAHGVRVRRDAKLICYCHSPARFLYRDQDYLEPAKLPFGVRQVADGFFAALRRIDRRNAKQVDRYLANSGNVARRIRDVYGIPAPVVYPPIDVERFRGVAAKSEDWLLVVSRLVPHKRVDLAIEACNRLERRLKVIGDGRDRARLEQLAGPTIEFLGSLDDVATVELYRRCRAFILPGVEDFGMTAIEAQAAGRPVIAYGRGGALESVIDGETGLFFRESTVESLAEAIKRFESMIWKPEFSYRNADRFGRERFIAEIEREIALL
jgi:glycosyltransferase involved in cell wall biosynthesis